MRTAAEYRTMMGLGPIPDSPVIYQEYTMFGLARTVDGSNNNDLLIVQGATYTFGAAGDDIIDLRTPNGWKGSKTFGGAGADTFVLSTQIGDLILDFNAAEGDKLDLSNVVERYSDLVISTGSTNASISYGNMRWYILGDDGRLTAANIITRDSLSAATSSGNDVVKGGTGHETLLGLNGADIVSGYAGNDTVNGNGGNDLVNGHDGNDLVHGGQGDDVVSGDGSDDLLYGDLGNDALHGGQGNDQMTGGAGADKFYFLGNAYGNDIVTDFQLGVDKLVFDATNMPPHTLALVNGSLVITQGANSITLMGVTGISQSDVQFEFT